MAHRGAPSNRHRLAPQGTAVLLVDVINSFDFPGAEPLVEAAEAAAPKIEEFCARARAAKVPIVFVNDNFGRWRSDFRSTLEACTRPASLGRNVSRMLSPHEEDYFVLKPMHSGFYSSALEVLLTHLGTKSIVLAGFATDLCILFTAHDAYMRKYELFVPRDLTAANTPELAARALLHMGHTLGAATEPSDTLLFHQ